MSDLAAAASTGCEQALPLAVDAVELLQCWQSGCTRWSSLHTRFLALPPFRLASPARSLLFAALLSSASAQYLSQQRQPTRGPADLFTLVQLDLRLLPPSNVALIRPRPSLARAPLFCPPAHARDHRVALGNRARDACRHGHCRVDAQRVCRPPVADHPRQGRAQRATRLLGTLRPCTRDPTGPGRRRPHRQELHPGHCPPHLQHALPRVRCDPDPRDSRAAQRLLARADLVHPGHDLDHRGDVPAGRVQHLQGVWLERVQDARRRPPHSQELCAFPGLLVPAQVRLLLFHRLPAPARLPRPHANVCRALDHRRRPSPRALRSPPRLLLGQARAPGRVLGLRDGMCGRHGILHLQTRDCIPRPRAGLPPRLQVSDGLRRSLPHRPRPHDILDCDLLPQLWPWTQGPHDQPRAPPVRFDARAQAHTAARRARQGRGRV